MGEVCEMIAETLMQQGEYDAAEQYLNRVSYIREQVERDEKGLIQTNLAIATCFKQRGQFLDAERILNECMVKSGILFGRKSEQVASVICEIGKAQEAQQNFQQALVSYKKAIELYREVSPVSSLLAIALESQAR